MPPVDLAIRSLRVVTPEGIVPACVQVRDGVIVAVGGAEAPEAATAIDAGSDVVMPGVVDTHVHVNEPGRTEWEGFETATRAAAAGGVTTLVDMPLNSVPATTTVAALEAKRAAATGRCYVDVGFWGGVVPGNAGELAALVEAGVFGFKCFLVPSGVDEFPFVGAADLEKALPILARLDVPLLVHAELPGPLSFASAHLDPTASPRRYDTYLATRPAAAEHEAVTLMIDLCRTFRARVHIVHLSSAGSLAQLRAARAEGLPITVETCPHYLVFCAEEVPYGATEFKCAPPIRTREHRQQLWDALGDGSIDLVATDHSPTPPAMKCRDTGDFLRAWGGIASLQFGLAALWTAARERGYTIRHLVEWLCRRPARLAGLDHRKGAIAPGRDADFVVWDPDAAFRVEPSGIHHRHSLTPYAGMTLRGAVRRTVVAGRSVHEEGRFRDELKGRILSRSSA